MIDMSNIREIAEVGDIRLANELLAAGYKLIACEQTTRAAKFEGSRTQDGQYVRKSLVYVIGRPDVDDIKPLREVAAEISQRLIAARTQRQVEPAAAGS